MSLLLSQGSSETSLPQYLQDQVLLSPCFWVNGKPPSPCLPSVDIPLTSERLHLCLPPTSVPIQADLSTQKL